MSVKVAKLGDFTKQREIAAGGEGKIYEHFSDPNKVVKIYHKARNAKFVEHLEKLSKELGSIAFIKPLDIFINNKGECIGFEMVYVDFNQYYLFNNLFNKNFCTNNGIDKSFKIQVINQLGACLESLHRNDITIGDFNQYNLFVGKDGRILFVDVDSYQTPAQPHSGVLLDDIRDWTTTAINNQTDIYAYDILAFWATTYCHPYKWVAIGNKESLEMRVKGYKSILSNIPNLKIPPLYEVPVGEVLKQFSDIFNHGRRYMVSFTGVHIPVAAVVKQQVPTSNNLTIRGLYKNVTDIHVCDISIAIKIGKNWSLIETTAQKIIREVFSIECDELYPAGSLFAYRKGDTLYAAKPGWDKKFQQPIFYYNNGMLCVVEYDRDLQWNFNLLHQLGGGIDNTNTPVFAKSIIKRAGLLQNFGSQKYLNVPNLNRYMMIPVPPGTKDGFYINNYIGVEVKRKNTVEYHIRDVRDPNNHKYMELDYLPHFAVALGGTIMIPEDGFIDVYTNLQLLTRLECSICTRDSKLYYTKSGILLLEDNSLYLLNTK